MASRGEILLKLALEKELNKEAEKRNQIQNESTQGSEKVDVLNTSGKDTTLDLEKDSLIEIDNNIIVEIITSQDDFIKQDDRDITYWTINDPSIEIDVPGMDKDNPYYVPSSSYYYSEEVSTTDDTQNSMSDIQTPTHAIHPSEIGTNAGFSEDTNAHVHEQTNQIQTTSDIQNPTHDIHPNEIGTNAGFSEDANVHVHEQTNQIQTTSDIQNPTHANYPNEIGTNAGFSEDANVHVHEQSNHIQTKRKRRKRQHVQEDDWERVKNKKSREMGKSYLGKARVDGKWKYDIPKAEKKLKERCACKPKVHSKMHCDQVSEEERKLVFEKFWKMTWQEKKLYIEMLVVAKPTNRARDRKNDQVSRRGYSYIYCLEKNQDKFRVCKSMFLNTFGISEKAVRNWKSPSVNQSKDGNNEDDGDEDSGENINNGEGTVTIINNQEYHERVEPRRNQRSLMFAEYRASLNRFFDSLPKMESHYCRKSSSKLYLERNWITKKSLYREYCRWCEGQSLTPLSVAVFHNVFEEKNLSLYQPKKDECDVCVGHNTGNITDEVFNVHQGKKDEARQEKEKDKESGKNIVLTMDLQSVLLSPKSNVSSLYYKTKLAVHNLTFFDLKTKDVLCYVWNESEGGLTANEFSSFICEFVSSKCPLPSDESIIIYSDGCCYQNRNAVLSNALFNLAKLKNITIEQKYLEKGHTQMEADSVHSQIEKKIRNLTVNVPGDYVVAIKQARMNPKPYEVKYVDHTFFKNYESLNFFKSIRPGKKVGDSCVTDIRAIKYSPEDIKFKLRHTDEWQLLPLRSSRPVRPKELSEIPSLYKERLAIKKRKYDDLQCLKSSMPSDFHSFYDNLPWK